MGKQAVPESTFKASEVKPLEMSSTTPGKRFRADWSDPATGKPFQFDELLRRRLLVKLESRMLADESGERYTQPAVCAAYAAADHAWRAEQRRPRQA